MAIGAVKAGKERQVVARLKHGMRLIFVASFVLAMTAIVLAVRLAVGPIAIGGLAPWIEKALVNRMPGTALRLEAPYLAWNASHRGFDILVPRAVLTATAWGGEIELSGLRLGLDPLMTPRRIEVDRLRGEVIWSGETTSASGTLLRPARVSPALDAALTRLVRSVPRRLLLAGAEITVRSPEGRTLFQLREGHVDAHLLRRGLRISAALALAPPAGTAARVGLEAELGRDGTKTVQLRVARLLPADFAETGVLPASLAGLDLPLDAHIDVVADGRGDIATARLRLDAGPGSIEHPPDYPLPLRLDGARIDLAYDGAARRLDVANARIAFAGTELFLSGAVILPAAAPPGVRLKGGFGPLSVRDLVTYWPRTRGAGARAWIDANLDSGRIDGANIVLNVPEWPGDDAAIPAEGLRLDFTFSALAGNYLRPMPRLLDASGSGRLSAADLSLRFEAGTIAGLPVRGSKVRLAGFDGPGVETGTIDVRMDGPLPDLLRLIDSPPLGYARAFGIAPEMIAGRAAVTARITLPLLKDARLEDVDLDLEAEIADLAIPDLVAGQALEAGRLDMRVDGRGLAAHGRARLADMPLRLAWNERFDAGPAPASRYEVRADLGPKELARLGLDASAYFDGTAALELRLAGNGARLESGAVSLDLSRAGLKIAALNWEKAAGVPGSLHAALDFRTARRIDVRRLAFAAGADRVAGALAFDAATGALLAADLERLHLGATVGAARFARAEDGAQRISFAGAAFDARGLLASLDAGLADRGAPAPPLALSFQADRVCALAGESFEEVALAAERSDDRWRRIGMTARVAGDGAISLDLKADGDESGRRFQLDAADAGRALRGLGLFDQAEGGRLTIEATLRGQGAAVEVAGTARMADVRLVKSTALRVESDPETKSRLDAYIGESGLWFDTVQLPFRFSGGVIDIDGAHANGPKLGLTLEGEIDERLEEVNVNGLIVPAYWLNSALGKLPLIGGLFSGGEGGGLFAFAYRIKGMTDDPEIRVSTMTGVLPGILRAPFTGGKGRLEKTPKIEEKAAPEESPGG